MILLKSISNPYAESKLRSLDHGVGWDAGEAAAKEWKTVGGDKGNEFPNVQSEVDQEQVPVPLPDDPGRRSDVEDW